MHTLHDHLLRTVADTGHSYTETGPLIPARDVLKRYAVVDRTLDRWLANPELDFPRPFVVNGRRYFRENALLEWERRQARAHVGSAA